MQAHILLSAPNVSHHIRMRGSAICCVRSQS